MHSVLDILTGKKPITEELYKVNFIFTFKKKMTNAEWSECQCSYTVMYPVEYQGWKDLIKKVDTAAQRTQWRSS